MSRPLQSPVAGCRTAPDSLEPASAERVFASLAEEADSFGLLPAVRDLPLYK